MSMNQDTHQDISPEAESRPASSTAEKAPKGSYADSLRAEFEEMYRAGKTLEKARLLALCKSSTQKQAR